MKALTIHQPFASLIMWGAKRYETRTWRTQYRGPLAIHAAGPRTTHWDRLKTDRHFTRVLAHRKITGLQDLPTSAVLCVVELHDVLPTAEIVHNLTDQEKAFGDFGWGRFAWKLKVLDIFPHPILTRGRQGLWTWEHHD